METRHLAANEAGDETSGVFAKGTRVPSVGHRGEFKVTEDLILHDQLATNEVLDSLLEGYLLNLLKFLRDDDL